VADPGFVKGGADRGNWQFRSTSL